MTTSGSARTLLLVALALGAAVLVGSAAILVMRGGDAADDGGGGADDDPATRPLGAGLGGRAAPRQRAQSGEEPEDDLGDDGIIEFPGAPRDPSGPEFVVDADSLRAVLAARHWEEIRRQIDVMQAQGTTVPADVVQALVAMLATDDLRLDAVLALGGVHDDATGRALAELACSSDADAATRTSALDALARSGQKASLPYLQQLVAAPGTDALVTRHALFAIARVGGPDATRTLLEMLAAHRGEDELKDAVVTALGKARDADQGLAATARGARGRGDAETLKLVLVAAQIQGADAGPETKAELARLVESAEAMSFVEDPEERLRVQAIAMPAAAAAGIVDPVLRAATTGGANQDIALHSLRQARGDDAARKISTALRGSSDEKVRRELTVALGETESFQATATLGGLLEDPSLNVKTAAALGLSRIRDPAAAKTVLAHLASPQTERDFARNLVVALGTIGATEALPTLEKLAASKEVFWVQLKPWVDQATVRIRTGNPESQALSQAPR